MSKPTLEALEILANFKSPSKQSLHNLEIERSLLQYTLEKKAKIELNRPFYLPGQK